MEKESKQKFLLLTAGSILVLTLLAPTAGCIILGAVILYHIYTKRANNDGNGDNRYIDK